MTWLRIATLSGILAGVATFILLAPTQCETHYMRFVPGGWDKKIVSTSCRGVAAFHYEESKELVGPRQPAGGTLPRPSLFQPQALITTVAVAGTIALFVWLIAVRPHIPRPARWVLLLLLLLLASLVSAIDPGGVVIYSAPILVPLFWWISVQSGVLARAFSAVVAGFLSVEAVALFTYGTPNAVVAPLLFGVAGAVVTLNVLAPRARCIRRPDFPNF